MALALLPSKTSPRILAAVAGMKSKSKEGSGPALEACGHGEWDTSRIVASTNRARNKICFSKALRTAVPARTCLRVLHSLVSLPNSFFPESHLLRCPPSLKQPRLHLTPHGVTLHPLPLPSCFLHSTYHSLIYFTHSCLFIDSSPYWNESSLRKQSCLC